MSADRLTLLAVDDERSQLEDLARLLRSFPAVEEVECAVDGADALVKASTQQFDAIFLDVRMPDLDGVELGRVLRRFSSPPELVFVSAYDHAAVEAFELRAVDYLRKPVGRQRLEEALDRVATAVEAHGATNGDAARSHPSTSIAPESEMIAVSALRGGATRLIARSSVLYIQSHGDSVRVVTEDGRYLLRTSLSELERRWERYGFVRVHRQYVANLTRAIELRPLLGGTAELTLAGGQTIPIARRHIGELGRRLGV
ncbi:MAG: LytR/AlgR family response regulator transcription factor [Solirubrobacteraceae bacterium]